MRLNRTQSLGEINKVRLSLSCNDVMIVNQDRRYSFFVSKVDI